MERGSAVEVFHHMVAEIKIVQRRRHHNLFVSQLAKWCALVMRPFIQLSYRGFAERILSRTSTANFAEFGPLAAALAKLPMAMKKR